MTLTLITGARLEKVEQSKVRGERNRESIISWRTTAGQGVECDVQIDVNQLT